MNPDYWTAAYLMWKIFILVWHISLFHFKSFLILGQPLSICMILSNKEKSVSQVPDMVYPATMDIIIMQRPLPPILIGSTQYTFPQYNLIFGSTMNTNRKYTQLLIKISRIYIIRTINPLKLISYHSFAAVVSV